MNDLAIKLPPPEPCPRGLSDADCDLRCCACCQVEDRFGDRMLCASCLTEMAEDQRQEEEDLRRERSRADV